MVACLIVGLQRAGHKAVNFDKLWEITQGLDKNPVQFLARLTEARQTREGPTRSGQIPPFSHCPSGSKTPSTNKERRPLGPCFKCSKEGHWVCSRLKPRSSLGPCPSCGIKGHWKVDCPNSLPGIQISPPGLQQESSNPALPSLLGLATED